MIRLSNKGLLIVISGPSGAGKGTICNELINDNKDLYLSISTTSRPIRNGDVAGVTYNFITKSEFEEKISNGDFLEYAIVHHGQYYGTPKDKVIEKLESGKDVIVELDINGALQIKNKFQNVLFIFILPPSMGELKKRLIARGTEDNDKIIERFKTAYKEINAINAYNYVVVNDNLEDAVSKVKAIILTEKCRVDRIEELDLNTLEEEMHEELVELENKDN